MHARTQIYTHTCTCAIFMNKQCVYIYAFRMNHKYNETISHDYCYSIHINSTKRSEALKIIVFVIFIKINH